MNVIDTPILAPALLDTLVQGETPRLFRGWLVVLACLMVITYVPATL